MNDYWRNYWATSHHLSSDDPQMQVARTRLGKPIAEKEWLQTLSYVSDLLEVNSLDEILDACGGNGLFSLHLAKSCREVTVVDINSALLSTVANKANNVKIINSELTLYLERNQNKFDKVLFYAGIQYFSEYEVFKIMSKIKKCLNPGGIVLIGDIPDFYKRDSFLFYSKKSKKYFDDLSDNKSTIGTWFTYDWIREMCGYIGYSGCELLVQPKYQIYHDFRFDVRLKN